MPFIKTLFLFLFSGCFLSISFAQRPHWDLPLFSVTTPGLEVRDMAADSDGNVYVLGNFAGTINFNPIGTASTRSSFANQNVFLAKYDRTGILLFVRAITSFNNCLGTSLVLDGDDFVYITGAFRGTANIQTGSGPTVAMTSNGDADMFVIKYNPLLSYQWSFHAGGTLEDGGNGIDVDDTGNVFVTGGFNDTVDFDGGGALPASVSMGGEDYFVLKLNQFSGNVIYRRTFGSVGDDRGEDIAVSSAGEIYVAGYANGSFMMSLGFDFFVPLGGQDGFIIRYDDTGPAMNFVAGLPIGGTGTDIVKEVEVGRDDQPVIAGNFQLTSDLGSGVTVVSSGNSDFFMAKYSNLLSTPTWHHAIGGTLEEDIEDLALNRCGEVFLSGKYQGTVDFNPGAGTRILTGPVPIGFLQHSGYFSAKFSANGTFILAGGEDVAGRDNNARAIALDPGGNMILGINASSAYDTDVSPNGTNLSRAPDPTADGQVVFISKTATGRVFVDNTAATGTGTLDEATLWTERNPLPDTVCFCLDGAGPFTINKPGTAFALTADSTVIDGSSQAGWTPGLITVDGAGSPLDGLFYEGAAFELYGLTLTGYDDAVHLQNSNDYVIGSPTVGNQLIGNQTGIHLVNSYGTIQHNEIGTDAAATTNLGNVVQGILLDGSPTLSQIGGLGANEGNTIGFNGIGILDQSGTAPVTIVGNRFACNAGGGIVHMGATPVPVITIPDPSLIAGTAPPNETIHLYSVDYSACGGTPPCQGYTYLGTATADGLGNWSIPGPFFMGMQVTTTSEDAAGKTSEFSLCALVSPVLDSRDDDIHVLPGQNAHWVVRVQPGKISMGLDGKAWTGSIHDLSGRVVWEGDATALMGVSTTDWATGIYVLRMRNESGQAHVHKLLIR